MKLKLLFVGCAISLGSFLTSASASNGIGDEPVKKNDVVGGVYNSDTRKPMNNVVVTAYSSASKKEKIVLTDTQGNYYFDELKPGTYKFVFEKDGYKKVIKEKTISRIDEAFLLNIYMEEQASFDFMPGPSHFFDLE